MAAGFGLAKPGFVAEIGSAVRSAAAEEVRLAGLMELVKLVAKIGARM